MLYPSFVPFFVFHKLHPFFYVGLTLVKSPVVLLDNLVRPLFVCVKKDFEYLFTFGVYQILR